MPSRDETLKRVATWFAFTVLTISAFTIRAWNLDFQSITHPEAYAPGIHYPAFSTQPIERLDTDSIVRSSLLSDNHPPGYYVLMLPWTKVFGTSLPSLRLPSAIIGALTIPILFLVAMRMEGPIVALFATTMLVLHSTHVMWSRSARMWVLCTAMAVVSVWALLQLRRDRRARWAVVYLVSLVVGLWSDYTFWPLLAAQILYELASHSKSRTLPLTLALQALAIVLGSPIFVFLMSRLGSSAYLEAPATHHVQYFLSLDALVDRGSLGPLGTWGTVLSTVALAAGAILITFGSWRGQRTQTPPDEADDHRATVMVERLLWLSLAWPLLLVWLWRDQPIDISYPVRTVTVAVAVATATGLSLARRYWTELQRGINWALDISKAHRVFTDASLVLAVVPFAILVAASLAMPALAPRSTLELAPFVLIVAARGLVWGFRGPLLRIAILALVISCGAISTFLVITAPPNRDYRGLANAINTVRQPEDVVVIANSWFAQPLNFYLSPDTVLSMDVAALETPGGLTAQRAWLVGFGDRPLRDLRALLRRTLTDYRAVLFVESAGAGALLIDRTPK